VRRKENETIFKSSCGVEYVDYAPLIFKSKPLSIVFAEYDRISGRFLVSFEILPRPILNGGAEILVENGRMGSYRKGTSPWHLYISSWCCAGILGNAVLSRGFGWSALAETERSS
jgi:hypothetical protein